ncbi:MAG: glucose-1-phosphate adenylyltransferase, partial [Erysipelotrichaceae bacterium]|nr:glucose-1-phosphate adenylyltransferase [Erysipelotrichaceae bacterium]
LFDPDWKIYTDDASATPQCIGENAKIDEAFITQGAIVNGEVTHSVIFSGAEVAEGAKVTDSVIMNNAVVGKGAKLTRCLVADDVRIPDGMKLGKKDSDEILLVSKALIAKAGENHE